MGVHELEEAGAAGDSVTRIYRRTLADARRRPATTWRKLRRAWPLASRRERWVILTSAAIAIASLALFVTSRNTDALILALLSIEPVVVDLKKVVDRLAWLPRHRHLRGTS